MLWTEYYAHCLWQTRPQNYAEQALSNNSDQNAHQAVCLWAVWQCTQALSDLFSGTGLPVHGRSVLKENSVVALTSTGISSYRLTANTLSESLPTPDATVNTSVWSHLREFPASSCTYWNIPVIPHSRSQTNGLNLKTRGWSIKTQVWSVVLYASETWTHWNSLSWHDSTNLRRRRPDGGCTLWVLSCSYI